MDLLVRCAKRCVNKKCIVANQHLTQNSKMIKNPIISLVFATLLAVVTQAGEAQTPETPAMPALRQSNQTELIWLTDLPNALVQA